MHLGLLTTSIELILAWNNMRDVPIPVQYFLFLVFKGGKIVVNFYTTWYCLNCFGQHLELFHSDKTLFLFTQ